MRYFLSLLGCLLVLSAAAQQMRVEDFTRYKHPFWQKATYETDKRQALLDLFTNEKGFQFFVGKTAVTAIEGEGLVTISLPHRTTSVTIKHPSYGQLVWKIPGKGVKRKKRYRAYLYTESVEKEYQQEKQWAVFSFEPQQAIFYLDSTTYLIQQGELALYLPIGMHACRVESPFYQPLSDTIELSDTVRLEKHFTLKTYYAYLTVQTSFPDAVILLDNKPIGKGQADTGRLRPGEYRLTVKREDGVYYDRTLELGNAERKVVDLRKVALRPHLPTDARLAERTEPTRTTEKTPAAPPDSLSVAPERPFEIVEADSASVSIRAFDDETEIWLNRQWVGKGSWQGRLAPGFYAISSQKEGLDSRTAYFWVEAGETVELNLASPLTDYGSLNVSCDEVNARIFLNGVEVGLSPRVLSRLPADRTYRLRMVKGKKEAEKVIHLKRNDILHVNLKLK